MRVAGVGWGVLSNGRQFELLKTKPNADRPTEVTLAAVELSKLHAQSRLLQLLSYESIQSGESERVAEQLEQTQRAIRTLREQKGAIADRVSQVVFDEVGEVKPQHVETESKEFVDRLIRAFDGTEPSSGSAYGGGSKEWRAWQSAPDANAIAGTISPSVLEGPDDDLVAVFPTQESGIPFLKENNAWGFVRLGRRPDWVAMYLTRSAKEVRYVAKVEDIVHPEDATLARPLTDYDGDQANFDGNKRVVVFEPGSLYELEDPIQYDTKYPQSLQYTTLEALRSATSTDELFAVSP
jgi:hypothetical protein